jgi:hypothetical protein
MSDQRPTPFTLVFGAIAPERFPPLRAGLEVAGRDPRDRDGFVLVREVAELLHDLRPEEGIGAEMETLVAFLHYAYLFWMNGEPVRRISEDELTGMLTLPTLRPCDLPTPRPSDVRYVQLPALRVWATPDSVAGQPAEPLDGWFVSREQDRLALLAVLGLSPVRQGLTAVELAGPRPAALQRLDGSPLFSPILAGGSAAGLASLAGGDELLELAWRVEEQR